MNIEIEDINSWPDAVRLLLADNLKLLSNHAARCIEIDNMEYIERISAANQYAYKRELIIEKINKIIKNCNLIGYHCTRLLDFEISDIKNNGMQLLSVALIKNRLEEAVTRNYISEELALYLLSKNQCADEFRQGRLWFVCGVSILKVEGFVVRLLKSWGGEALYNSHEIDDFSGTALRNIGTPCIIRCMLVPDQLQLYIKCIGEKIEEAFLQKHGICTPNNPQFDTHMRQPLPPKQILKIIEIGDPEFLTITDYVCWHERI